METVKEIMQTIKTTWVDNQGGLTMAACDELAFGQSLLADWNRETSRDFSWEEYMTMSPTSQEMVDCYHKAFLARFMAQVEVCPVVGLPSNCPIRQLKRFLLNQDSLRFEFSRKGKSLARCYWASGWDDKTKTWTTGGCISCLLSLETLKDLLVEVGANVPISIIDAFRVNSDDSIDFHCDNGWNYTVDTDGYIYELGTDA